MQKIYYADNVESAITALKRGSELEQVIEALGEDGVKAVRIFEEREILKSASELARKKNRRASSRKKGRNARKKKRKEAKQSRKRNGR